MHTYIKPAHSLLQICKGDVDFLIALKPQSTLLHPSPLPQHAGSPTPEETLSHKELKYYWVFLGWIHGQHFPTISSEVSFQIDVAKVLRVSFFPLALLRVLLVQPGTESRWSEVQLSWPQLSHRENVAYCERNTMESGATALAQCPAHRARMPCKRGRILSCSPRPGEWLRDLTTTCRDPPMACRDPPTELIRISVDKKVFSEDSELWYEHLGHSVSSVEATSKPQATWITTDNQMKK